MPKKIVPDEEYEEEYEDEEDEEDEEEKRPQSPPPARGRPMKVAPRQRPAPTAPRRRYSAFQQQAAEGIIDAETQEVIASDILTALANIIERLERIENSVGVMQEG